MPPVADHGRLGRRAGRCQSEGRMTDERPPERPLLDVRDRHAVPRDVRRVPARFAAGQGDRRRPHRRPPHQPARLRAGPPPVDRRHPLRRRARDDPARRAGGRARWTPSTRRAARRTDPAHAPGATVRSAARPRAGCACPRIAFVCGRYEGVDERVGAAALRRAAEHRRLRPGRRRGGRRRDHRGAGAPGPGRHGLRSVGRATNRSRPTGSSTRSGRAPRSGRGSPSPRSCCPGDHQAVAALAATRGVETDPAAPPGSARRTTP